MFPEIEPSQYVLLHVEVDTGIVLNLDGERATKEDHRYLVFDTFASLEAYAITKIHLNPDIECIAFDYQQKSIKVFRNDSAIQDRVRLLKKPWWQFWS